MCDKKIPMNYSDLHKYISSMFLFSPRLWACLQLCLTESV